jgi:hypothetical protein
MALRVRVAASSFAMASLLWLMMASMAGAHAGGDHVPKAGDWHPDYGVIALVVGIVAVVLTFRLRTRGNQSIPLIGRTTPSRPETRSG